MSLYQRTQSKLQQLKLDESSWIEVRETTENGAVVQVKNFVSVLIELSRFLEGQVDKFVAESKSEWKCRGIAA